ncbi:MAG: hypothetical protein U9O53_05590 [archaeon]|nr:hypothetical protein [archaeon]
MGTLNTHRLYASEMKDAGISIVDALTGSDPCYIEMLVEIDMSCVDSDLEYCSYLGEEKIRSGRVKSRPLAINYADRLMPPTILDPEKETVYRIYPPDDGAAKVICSHESDMDRFRDAVKPAHHNKYIWKGTVDEMIEEFKNAGFVLMDKIPIDEINKFQERYEESRERQDDIC